MPTLRLLKSEIDRLPSPREGQVDYFDSDLPGFLLRVSPRSKVYYVSGRLRGKKIRLKIGTHGVYTPDQARTLAREWLLALSRGIDPRQVRRDEDVRNMTLREALELYLGHRDLKPSTRESYRYTVGLCLPDWLDRPLADISREGVLKKHKDVTERHGPVPANYTFRILRAVFNFIRVKYEGPDGDSPLRDNPVRILSSLKTWNREKTRRENFLRESDLPAWGQAVRELSNPDLRDYLFFLVLTGLRRRDAATLRWKDISFTGETLTVSDPKNRRPHTLPLSSVLKDLLLRRKRETSSLYVFPGSGKSGHLEEPRRAVNQVKARTGAPFTLHDLRRTFTVCAENRVPYPALKRLLGHASGGDVTLHNYVGHDIKTLRKYMEEIDSFIWEKISEVREAKESPR